MIDFRDEIKKTVEVLRKGGLILYPTDTVWGIGCDATNYEAVQRIFEIKQRDISKKMLILLENPNSLTAYVDQVPDVAWDLIEFTEKPTTIIYDKAKNLATNLVAPDGSIAVRITKEHFTQQLIQRFRKPLVATSANISGQATPENFDNITEHIKSHVDYIVKYRQSETNNPETSSIIRLGSSGLFSIIRK